MAGTVGTDLRAALRASPLRPYEALMPDDVASRAPAILESGWAIGRFPPLRLEPPVAWDEAAASDRSWHFQLQSWTGLGALLAAHSELGDEASLRRAYALALDWARAFPSVDTPSPFAWYDMAIGLRAFRLGYVIDAAARESWAADDDLDVLVASARTHLQALADDDRFAGHSNHGVYQAAGQAALARRLPQLTESAAATPQASGRLRDLILEQFSSEGVHREHSPGYHRLVLETFARLLRTGLLDDPRADQRYDAAEEALAWFLLPDGTLALFGDTLPQFEPRHLLDRSPALRFVASGGARGAPPAETHRAFPEGGYVVFRDRWPAGVEDFADCSYLAQTTAFHSRQHKHADHLSVVWFDRGRQLLVDPGRFGYLGKVERNTPLFDAGFGYSDPRRVYVESSRAHNTVEIDGRSHPRRRVPFFGSALEDSGVRDGVRWSRCRVDQAGVAWTRTLLFVPRRFLLVLDDLVAEDGLHEFRQSFQLAPQLEVRPRGNGFVAALDASLGLHLTALAPAAAAPPVKGQTEPELLGFVSPEVNVLVPTWTVAFTGSGTAHRFATLLSLAQRPPAVEAGAAAEPGSPLALRWVDDARHQLELGADGPAYRSCSRLRPWR